MSAQLDFFHDRLTRFLVEGAPFRILEVDVRDSAQEAAKRHETSEVAARAMAQALGAAALLSGHIKGDEKLTFQCRCQGALGSLIADCSAEGDLRASVKNPQVNVTGDAPDARLLKALGGGAIYVIKSTPEKELYRGTAPFDHTDLAGALEVYLEVSEQVPSLAFLAIGQDGKHITAARGVLIQLLGGGDRAAFEALGRALDADTFQAGLEGGRPLPELLLEALPEIKVLELESLPLRFHCPCSTERVAAVLLTLGAQELASILEEQGSAEVTCQFCRARYSLGRPELTQLLRLAQGIPQPGDGTPLN